MLFMSEDGTIISMPQNILTTSMMAECGLYPMTFVRLAQHARRCATPLLNVDCTHIILIIEIAKVCDNVIQNSCKVT